MASHDRNEYLAECYWPDVKEGDLVALDQRAQIAADRSTREGSEVRYLGSLLMREDEVILCRFQGSEASVRRVAEWAAIPFERMLAAVHSPRRARPPEWS